MMDIKHQTSVSLVLGSGGARGLAHIGIIRWLDEHHYQIKSISGCSVGALIGGIYAAGKLDEFEQWVIAITKVDVVALLDISWQKSGLLKGDRIINTLIDLVGDQLIEELPIRFTAVAADIAREKEIWINSGNLFQAIRASISLPLFFTPFEYHGDYLIDGGVLNPVPIAPTFGDKTDITLAVNLGGTAKQIKKKPVTVEKEMHQQDSVVFAAKELADISSLRTTINGYINRLKKTMTATPGHDWGPYDVANQAFDAMQSTIARQKLAAYPPDKVIEIARDACGMFDIDQASKMIELGYRQAEHCFSQNPAENK